MFSEQKVVSTATGKATRKRYARAGDAEELYSLII